MIRQRRKIRVSPLKVVQAMLFGLLLITAGCAELQNSPLTREMLGWVQPRPGSALDERTVAAGLKDALRVGTERTVGSTSRVDGFLSNALIRIALPEQIQPMARALKSLGLGSKIDGLEVAMNRAAERAAGEAKGIFWEAITQMTLSDAFGILNGGNTAATDYFRDRTTHSLRARFHPIVSEKMSEVGLYRIYDQLMKTYSGLPLASKAPLDLESYTTEKALEGLFSVLAQEEERIRQNPAARTTELLRQVFGG